MNTIEIQVLGPIRALVAGSPVALRGHTERALLVALVLTVNHSVSTEHLEFALWGDLPPGSARNTLQSAMSRLKRKLGGVIASDGHAYRLEVDPDVIDVVRFEKLVVAAADALDDEPARARELASEAMRLWRGQPFDDLAEEEFVLAETARLEELRLAAGEIRLEADVAVGRLAQVIPRLRAELAEQPYRERLWYLLMLALARDGRRVEALRAYHDAWEVLDGVGLQPTRALRRLEELIIEEDPAVDLRLARSIRVGIDD